MKQTMKKLFQTKVALALLLCVLTATEAWAGYGWYSASMSIGGVTTNPTEWSTDSENPTDLGNLTNMTITSIAFNVWSDANDRSGANMYFRIWDGGASQVGDDQDLHLGSASRISGDHDFSIEWTGEKDLADAVGLTLEEGHVYYIDMWAKTYGTSGDEWYSANSNNYHAMLTYAPLHTVTYDLAGGTLPAGKSNPTSYTVVDQHFLLTNPTKEGYAFVGWNYDYTEGNYTFNETHVFVDVNPVWKQDFAFTATWVEVDETHKDLAKCRIEVDNPLYIGTGNYVGYFYDGGNGIKVYDGETLLTYGTDYMYSMLVSLDGGNCEDLGEHCRVLLSAEGNYVGGLSADVTIVPLSEASGTWGDLSWTFNGSAGTLSITGTGDMDTAANNTDYPWYEYASYITSITIDEDITSVAANAFGGTRDVHSYGSLTTVTLPNTLTTIGVNAFAYCDNLTIDLDAILANNIIIGENAFIGIGCLIGSLANNADDTDVIDLLNKAKSNNITLQGRTLYKDDKWNTLCLPFSINDINAQEDEVYTCPLHGATVKELDVDGYYEISNPTTRYIYFYDEKNKKYVYTDESGNEYKGEVSELRRTSFDASDGTLYLYFKNADRITAGKPYIIKWASGDDIENPVFTGVTIDNSIEALARKTVTSSDSKVQFIGTYEWQEYTEENQSILFVGEDNNLHWPLADASLGAFRAYFQLADGVSASEFVLNFGADETSGIHSISKEERSQGVAGAWYTINAVRLNGKPTQKGLYIHNGRKVIVK